MVSIYQKFNEINCAVCYEPIIYKAAYGSCLHELCLSCIIKCFKISSQCPYCKTESIFFYYNVQNHNYKSKYNLDKCNLSMILDCQRQVEYFLKNRRRQRNLIKSSISEIFFNKVYYKDYILKSFIYFCNLTVLIPSTINKKNSPETMTIEPDNPVWNWLEEELLLYFKKNLQKELYLIKNSVRNLSDMKIELKKIICQDIINRIWPFIKNHLKYEDAWTNIIKSNDNLNIVSKDGRFVLESGSILADTFVDIFANCIIDRGINILGLIRDTSSNNLRLHLASNFVSWFINFKGFVNRNLLLDLTQCSLHFNTFIKNELIFMCDLITDSISVFECAPLPSPEHEVCAFWLLHELDTEESDNLGEYAKCTVDLTHDNDCKIDYFDLTEDD